VSFEKKLKLIYYRFRKAIQRLIVNKSFDYSVLFFIALNCITLAMERPSIPAISFVCFYSLNKTEEISLVLFS